MNHTPTIKKFAVKLRSSIIAACLMALFGVLMLPEARAASGDVDPTFSTAAFSLLNSGVEVTVAQPDGKYIVGGNFTVAGGRARFGLARLNSDGTLDTTFEPPEFYDYGTSPTIPGATIRSIALQSNGKILVGGRFTVSGSSYESLVRLNSNGSIDTSFFDMSIQFFPNDEVRRIIVLPDDTFVIGGSFSVGNQSGSTSQIAKFDPNGNFNPAFRMINFGGTLRDFAVQPDGKVIVCDLNIQRQNADGSTDPSYPVVIAGGISRMVLRPDNKLLIAGSFQQVNGFAQGRLALINSDASLDLTFNQNGIGAVGGNINDVILTSQGTMFVGGTFTQFNGISKNRIARLNSDGSVDPAFTYTPPNSNTVIKDLEYLNDGRLVVSGNQTATVNDSVTRLNVDGSIDSAFSGKIGRNERVRKIVQAPDGKIFIAGEFRTVLGVTRVSLARLNSDGSLDTSFVPYFNNSGNLRIESLVVQNDGKVVIGFYGLFGMKRLNTDGSQDTTFVFPLSVSASVVYDIVITPSGGFMIAGLLGQNQYVVRLNANGSFDNTMTPAQPNGAVNKIQLLGDGSYYLCGDFTQVGVIFRGRVAKFNADGTLNTVFNPLGGANAGVFDCKVQTNGKLVIGGYFTSINGSNLQKFIGRFNTNGTIDTGFAQSVNSPLVNGQVTSVEIQADGKILVGGIFADVGGTARSNLARLNSNGSLDNTFVANTTAQVFDVGMQTDNKILVGGDFAKINGSSAVGAGRLLNTLTPARTPFDYDGDGKSDVSVFRASENNWYILRSSDFGVTQSAFAIAGDVPVPADFDGDGKTDVAIFRPSNGNWWSLSSINGQQINFPFGTAGDIPLPSDFDGDGRSDYVVFRPSTNQWLRASSANGAQSNKAFGLAGDKPVIGDFDGDGKSDVAVYRPSDGNWWWWSSFDNVQRATRWGIASDIPAPADFDGDGKTDFAVFRPSTGVWYIYNSATATPLIGPFGLTGDKPVPADFDGDGKADIAVYRPSDGIWYLLRTTSGFTGFRFGIATDTPTQNAFLQ